MLCFTNIMTPKINGLDVTYHYVYRFGQGIHGNIVIDNSTELNILELLFADEQDNVQKWHKNAKIVCSIMADSCIFNYWLTATDTQHVTANEGK